MVESYKPQVRFPLLKSASLTVTDGTLQVTIGGHQYALQGQDAANVMRRIFPRVDGWTTREELAADMARTESTSEDWNLQALDRLIETGMCVVDREQPGDRPWRHRYLAQIAHFGQHVTSPSDCQRRLRHSRVAVIGAEYLGSLLVQHLASTGIGHLRAVGPSAWSAPETPFVCHGQPCDAAISRHTLLASHTQALGAEATYEGIPAASGTPLDWEAILPGCDLVALVLPQRLPALLRTANQVCLSRNIPLLPMWMEDTGMRIGPLVVPHETPCLVCLELRQGESLSLEDLRAMHDTEVVTLPPWESPALLIPWASAVAAMAAGEIVAALTRYRQPASYGHTLFMAAHDWRLQATPVLKIPRCPACSPLRHFPSPHPFALPGQEEPDAGE